MHLYLVQHAEARPKDEDPQRPLSEKGRADIQKVAAFLAGHEAVKVSHILHSGKLRAGQTAEALAEHLHPGSVTATDGLNPLDDPTVWADRLTETDEDLMLVGHLPHMSRLAARLITGDADQPVVQFRMGGVVCLGRDKEGWWSLRWMVVPEILT
jgi:phosphohistidine phosphatase